jgi:tetratricopeptide (TPR) repeat protein
MIVLVLILALLAAACGGDPAERAREYTASGDRYAAQGRLKEAVIEYRNAVKTEPRSYEAHAKLGRTYVRLGRAAEAYESLSRASELNPSDVGTELDLASILIAAGDYERARVRAERAVKRDSSNADALVVLGTALAGLKRLEDAVRHMERATRLSPSHAGSFTALGSMRLVQGNRAEAERLLTRAAELDQSSARPHLALANLHWAVGDREATGRALATALAREPDNRLALRASAMYALATNQAQQAERHLTALAADGAPADQLALVELQAQQGRHEDALKAIAPILKSSEANVEAAARALHARLLLAATPPEVSRALAEAEASVRARSDAPEAHYARGLALTAAGRYDEADRAYAEVLRLDPRASAAAIQRSKLGLARGDAEAAIEAATAAASGPAATPGASLQLVRSLRAAGRVDAAQVELNALRRRVGENRDILTEAGWLALASGDRASARAAFDRTGALDGLVAVYLAEGRTGAARSRARAALEKQPDDPELLVLAARVEIAAGDGEAAQKHLTRAISRDDTALEAYYLLADLYRKQGDVARVRAEYERAAAARPDATAPTRTLLGLLDQGEGRAVDAESHYRAALARDPRAAVAANNLAWILAERGEFDEALPFARTAARELPGRAEVQHTLGWILLKQGRARESIAPLEQAATLAPGKPQYGDHLAEARTVARRQNRTETPKGQN